MLKQIKHLLFGAPIATQHAEHEKLSVPLGLAVFASDALSSTAYATDEILIALAASAVAMQAGVISLPIALIIVTLIGLVVVSYRQIIRAYPEGGGAYIVAKRNLGTFPSHIAAASLLIDYVLTVAVSISAGIAAITSTGLLPYTQATFFCILCTLIILYFNLRGLRESGRTFAVPAYIFLFSIAALIAVGLWKLAIGQGHVTYTTLPTEINHLNVFATLGFIPIFLKAFSHGCVGLTGIEAVSNGIKAFKAPSAERANKTMLLMGCLLGGIFLGITILAFGFHIGPKDHETIISQVSRVVFGGNTFFYFLVQFSTMVLLILAANTAFSDFPRVSSLLANDGFLPRQLMNLGDRLMFNNGIFILGILSILLIWVFHGDTHALIPLYAVGVFISFTLSQAGMVRHHLREHEPGWRRGVVINAVGAVSTGCITLILAFEKFMEGAWIIFVAIPVIIVLFNNIYAHYRAVSRQLALDASYSCPIPRKHKAVVLVSGLGKNTIPALQYAKAIAEDVEAIHVELNLESTQRLKQSWEQWGCGIPLKSLPSPYRTITEPMLEYIATLRKKAPEELLTVIVPEFVTKKFWHNILHNQTAIMLKALLRFQKGTIVTTVRFHLEE